MTWLLRNARLWGVENTHDILLKAGQIFLDTDEGSIFITLKSIIQFSMNKKTILPKLTQKNY